MNTYKSIFISILLVGLSTLAFSQDEGKTLVKSFNLQGNTSVELGLQGDVDVQRWNNSIMRIQMNIVLENGTSSMLKSLVQVGRYNLKSVTKDGTYKVYAPGMDRDVRIKGKELIEAISYTVYLPNDVELKEAGTAAVQSNIEVTEIR